MEGNARKVPYLKKFVKIGKKYERKKVGKEKERERDKEIIRRKECRKVQVSSTKIKEKDKEEST